MNTLSPWNNRYKDKVLDVIEHFNIFNFTKYKVTIECEYFIFFTKLLNLENTESDRKIMNNILKKFNVEDSKQIDMYEKETNHDIQALINFLKNKISIENSRWIHFGLTSQDINNPSMMMMYRDFNNNIFKNELSILINSIKFRNNFNCKIITFTHGQPATPSNIKHQLSVYTSKLYNIWNDIFKDFKYKTKIGGSNGQLTGLKYCFPHIDWEKMITNFVETNLNLGRNEFTTQIDDYSNYFKLFQVYERLSYILIDFCQDIWLYCHRKYIVLENVKNEVGSSAMPHKINPIQFENAEGNLKIAASLFHTIGTLYVSRLQRDLVDSTMLRNVGLAFGHLLLSIRNITSGIKRDDQC